MLTFGQPTPTAMLLTKSYSGLQARFLHVITTLPDHAVALYYLATPRRFEAELQHQWLTSASLDAINAMYQRIFPSGWGEIGSGLNAHYFRNGESVCGHSRHGFFDLNDPFLEGCPECLALTTPAQQREYLQERSVLRVRYYPLITPNLVNPLTPRDTPLPEDHPEIRDQVQAIRAGTLSIERQSSHHWFKQNPLR